MRQGKRDPFARTTEYSQAIPSTKNVACKWCGQGIGKNKKQYGIYHDGITNTIHWNRELFCSRSCYLAYKF